MNQVLFKQLHTLEAFEVIDNPEILAACIAREYLNIDVNSLDQRGLDFIYSSIPSEVLSIEQVIRYSQGYSGKHGFNVYRIKFKGMICGYLKAEGRWTDEYTFLPFGNQDVVLDLISFMRKNLTSEVSLDTYGDEDIFVLPKGTSI